MAYQAICFDIDGTLYDNKIMNRRIGSIWFFHPIMGMKFKQDRRQFRQMQHTYKQSIPLRWREAMIIKNGNGVEPDCPFDKESYKDVYEKMDRVLYRPMRRMFRKTKSHDGVRDTFECIRAKGLKVGVLSDFPIYEKLEGLEVADLVDFACSSDDTLFLKPDAHCFDFLLYNLKVAPKDTLYVGDSYDKDVVGAVNSGIDAVLVGVNESELSEASAKYPLAKAVFSSWKDFDNWLRARIGEN